MAVGKSSVGLLLAERLHFQFFDTGVMYRTFTWKALSTGLAATDAEALAELAEATQFQFVPGTGARLLVLLDGKDVSSLIGAPEVERNVSLIAKLPRVRERMVSEQRRMASETRLVMAGRDIGTVVLPWADLKVFLQASIEERARRRFSELQSRGISISYTTVLAELRQRDHNDITRTLSPLKAAKDAITINTDGHKLEEVVERILTLVRERADCI